MLIDAGGRAFTEAFGRRPLSVRHSLAGHRLLVLEAIAELADSLPAKSVERHAADLPVVMPGGAPELSGRPSDTVRGIERNGAWMVLWYIEQSPAYAELLNQCLDGMQALLPENEGRLRRQEAFLFLSAPNAVTPVHFDP